MAVDLLQGLKDAVVHLKEGIESGEEEDPKESLKQLLKALKELPGISEKEKDNFVKSVLGDGLLDGAADLPGNQLPLGSPISNPWLEFAVLFGLISCVILLLAFIGYRLYQNMINRDQRKELKRIQKQQKKKK